MDIQQVVIALFEGFGMSVAIFFATLAVALPLGLLFAFLQKCKFKPVKYLMDAFIWIIRGTQIGRAHV